MNIKEKVEKALADNKRMAADDLQKLSEFVEELKREGLFSQKQYDLPPLDTVGRQLYRENALRKFPILTSLPYTEGVPK